MAITLVKKMYFYASRHDRFGTKTSPVKNQAVWNVISIAVTSQYFTLGVQVISNDCCYEVLPEFAIRVAHYSTIGMVRIEAADSCTFERVSCLHVREETLLILIGTGDMVIGEWLHLHHNLSRWWP